MLRAQESWREGTPREGLARFVSARGQRRPGLGEQVEGLHIEVPVQGFSSISATRCHCDLAAVSCLSHLTWSVTWGWCEGPAALSHSRASPCKLLSLQSLDQLGFTWYSLSKVPCCPELHPPVP